MEIIHYTDRKIGSFDWELPHDISDLISKLPSSEREKVLKLIEGLTTSYLRLLMIVILMDEHRNVGLEMMSHQQIETAQILTRFMQMMKAGGL